MYFYPVIKGISKFFKKRWWRPQADLHKYRSTSPLTLHRQK